MSCSKPSILIGSNRTPTINHISRLFEKVVKSPSSKSVALIFEENGETRQLSYLQVDQITNRFARTIIDILRTKNVTPNSDGDYIVAVNMHPSDYLILVLLAIWKSGCAYLPLDHDFPSSRIEHIIRDVQPVMVIYDQDTNQSTHQTILSCEKLVEMSCNRSEKKLEDTKRLHHQKDDLAMVLYTSGSTGIPKGVRLLHRNILNRLQWQFEAFPYSESEKVCVFKTSFAFVDSCAEIWGPLISGLSLLVLPKSMTLNTEKFINKLDAYGIERLVLVPSLLKSILMCLELKENKFFLRSLRLWICSGDTLTTSLSSEFFNYFPENEYRLCNFYGSTEIMADVTFYVISDNHQLKNYPTVPIGTPVDNTIVYLLDSDLQPVKQGDVGEIFVSGSNLASGYVNIQDEKKFLSNHMSTKPTFSKLYRTGDFGRIKDGILLYEGRKDSQVKVRGYRVELSEVEKVVNEIEGVENAVVLCYSLDKMNQIILAFVKFSTLMKKRQFESMLKSKLISYMVPKVVLVDAIPLLGNGKVDRQALLTTYRNTNSDNPSFETEFDYTGVKPDQMYSAKFLFNTVSSALNKTFSPEISLKTNFYDIGGNSLNSIYTITKLNKEGFHISVADFLSANNLGEILERMTSSSNSESSPLPFTIELLNKDHKLVVLDIIATGFQRKGDLEKWLPSETVGSDYSDFFEAIFQPLIDDGLSFVAKSLSGKIIAVSINCDFSDRPIVEVNPTISVMKEFIESLEKVVVDLRLPCGKGEAFYEYVIATHSSLLPKENVAVIQFMENEVIKLATKKHFKGIFTTNSSPLTQQMTTEVYHYQTLLDCQVNQYVAPDGTKPFDMAPNSQRSLVQWKFILNEKKNSS